MYLFVILFWKKIETAQIVERYVPCKSEFILGNIY